SAAAKGFHSSAENGVPWQNTTAGPDPDRPHAISRSCQLNRSSRSTRATVSRHRPPGHSEAHWCLHPSRQEHQPRSPAATGNRPRTQSRGTRTGTTSIRPAHPAHLRTHVTVRTTDTAAIFRPVGAADRHMRQKGDILTSAGARIPGLPPSRQESFLAYFPVAALNLVMSSAGTRPRSLTSIPWALAHSRASVGSAALV